MKPRLLDLFCGAGGCSVGYERAGFEVVGVDIKPQPNYPFMRYADGCLDWLEQFVCLGAWPDGQTYHAIHASPPCQAYSLMTRNKGTAATFPDLVGPTRAMLQQTGLPYVIENVEGAPLVNAVLICGTSLGLGASGMDLPRHRLFECSFPVMGVPCSRQSKLSMGVYGNGTNSWHRKALGRNLTVDEMREAMGIDWMPRSSLNQAIPPAYTEHIGGFLMAEINARQAA